MSRLAGCFVVTLVLVTAAGLDAAESASELKLGPGSAAPGGKASVALSLSSTSEVEGLAAIFEWDGAVATGVGLIPAATIASADVVVTRVEANYMVLGVVVDSDGVGSFTIPPGQNQLLATAEVRIDETATVGATAELTFVDNKYASAATGPLLENLLTVGGLSITKDQGLILAAGSVTVTEPTVEFAYRLSAASPVGGTGCGPVQVLLDATAPVEGYEIAISHPSGITLDAIDIGEAASSAGADFSSAEVLAAGGTFAVVLDAETPFEGNTIAPGEGLEIAVYRYCCKGVSQSTQYDLTFVDGVLGTPRKENAVVTGGQGYAPTVTNGTFRCVPAGEVEICDNEIDDNGNGLVDCDDPQCWDFPGCRDPNLGLACGAPATGSIQDPPPASGAPGETATVCFYYRSVADAVQGISMAVCSSCDASPQEGTYDTSGTIVEAVGAEYVHHEVDNDPDDGDGCELIVGILVDQLPPFEGGTLPSTETYLSLGCIEYQIADKPALAGSCLELSFCDGANGPGKIPIRNLFSIDNQSRMPVIASCDICVEEEGLFHRGDCNYSNIGEYSVDIADAAAMVSFLITQGALKYEPPCLDACDCNDDGRIDLADVTCVLRYLFQSGPFPPAPGPGWEETGKPNPERVRPIPPGPDPTPDDLDCAGSA